MNILFFLIPKSEVAYIFEDETLRQTLEKMEHRKYSCIPILTMDGKYLGTISEGDLLWGMRRADIHDIKETEGIPIMAIPRRATYKPVHADSNMEDLLDRHQSELCAGCGRPGSLYRNHNQKIYHQILLQRNKSRTKNCR